MRFTPRIVQTWRRRLTEASRNPDFPRGALPYFIACFNAPPNRDFWLGEPDPSYLFDLFEVSVNDPPPYDPSDLFEEFGIPYDP